MRYHSPTLTVVTHLYRIRLSGLATHFLLSDQLEDVETRLSMLDNYFLDTIDAAIQEIAAERHEIAEDTCIDFWEKSKIIERYVLYTWTSTYDP